MKMLSTNFKEAINNHLYYQIEEAIFTIISDVSLFEVSGRVKEEALSQFYTPSLPV